jgi:hypothetical protein
MLYRGQEQVDEEHAPSCEDILQDAEVTRGVDHGRGATGMEASTHMYSGGSPKSRFRV